jgi:hypothetical protein
MNLIMKKSSLLIAGLSLLSLSLTQCVVAPVPVVTTRPVYYGSSYGSTYYGAGRPAYYGGYGATGRVATNAMWAGVAAYGIHERNETRQNRVNHAVNHYHGPSGGAYRSGGYRGGRRR